MNRSLYNSQFKYLRMLRLGPFERRTGDGWRFGTRRIADSVVDRLVANGRAEIEGGLVRLVDRKRVA